MNSILALLTTSAVLTDLTKGKIYNVLVFPAMAAGVLLHIESGGLKILPAEIFSIFVPFLLLLPFWFLGTRGIAAGDIKLFMAISSLMELSSFLKLFAASFLIGAVISLIVLCKTHNLKSTIHFALPIGCATIAYLGGLL